MLKHDEPAPSVAWLPSGALVHELRQRAVDALQRVLVHLPGGAERRGVELAVLRREVPGPVSQMYVLKAGETVSYTFLHIAF